MTNAQRVIMHYTTAPNAEDLEVIAASLLEALPDELREFCDDLAVRVEEWPEDNGEESGAEGDDPYDLLLTYKSGREVAPGIETKGTAAEDILVIYRRPLLDMWSETGEDLSTLLRHLMIEEVGRHFNFSEDEIGEMTARHYQGLL